MKEKKKPRPRDIIRAGQRKKLKLKLKKKSPDDFETLESRPVVPANNIALTSIVSHPEEED